MARERGDSGEFVEIIILDRVANAIREVDSPPVTTRDIADRLDCTTEAACQKLVQLAEQSRVNRRKVGGRAVVWWLTESEQVTTDSLQQTLLRSRNHDQNERISVAH